MRLWSLHPKYLDRAGLLACWREGLLAKAVLEGKTKGYINHPQLQRFKDSLNPIGYINSYLHSMVDEAQSRGYNFDCTKLLLQERLNQLTVNNLQIEYEKQHLKSKLAKRDSVRLKSIAKETVDAHPLFSVVDGPIEPWEKL